MELETCRRVGMGENGAGYIEQFSPRISLDMMVCCGMMTGDPRCTSLALVQAMQQSK